MLIVRRFARPQLIIASVGLAAFGLAGCREIDGRIHTGSIKDSIIAGTAGERSAAPRAAKPAKAAPKKVAAAAPVKPAPAKTAADAKPAPKAAPAVAAAPPKPDNRGPVQIVIDDARALMAKGDVVAARAKLEQGMTKARSPYLLDLARTYDPNYLGRVKRANAKADAARASELYKEAAGLGSSDAAQDMQRLSGKR